MTTVPELVRRHWEHLGTDVDRAHAMYHEDAVLEFPQSGERFEGLAYFANGAAGIQRACASSSGGSPHAKTSWRIYVMERWEAPAWRAPWRAARRAEASN